MKSLGGSSFVYNGIKQDYNFIETLNCLHDLCDEVAIAVGGDDGTPEKVYAWFDSKRSGKIKVIYISEEDWNAQQGREKLSYFSNLAIQALSTDWNIYCQCDETIHESSFFSIRKAIEMDQEAFFCHRINLWSSPYTALNVSQDRKPVSTQVIRLAKTKYRCVGDAESLGLMPSVSTDFFNEIRIYHTGFVRDKHKHLVKIKHIQEDIFLFGEADKRINDCVDGFDCWKFGFSPADVEPITEKLPKFIQKWACEREYDPFKLTDHGYDMAKQWFESVALEVPDFINTIKLRDKFIEEANKLWWRICKIHQL